MKTEKSQLPLSDSLLFVMYVGYAALKPLQVQLLTVQQAKTCINIVNSLAFILTKTFKNMGKIQKF